MTWLTQSVVGGLLLAVSATAFLALSGRILGVSGILFGLLKPMRGDTAWRVAFVLGLVAAGLVARAVIPGVDDFVVATPLPRLILAGLLVGYGTRLGSGCTSGHGICGVARLSPRSLVATAVFLATGIVTVLVMKHGLGG